MPGFWFVITDAIPIRGIYIPRSNSVLITWINHPQLYIQSKSTTLEKLIIFFNTSVAELAEQLHLIIVTIFLVCTFKSSKWLCVHLDGFTTRRKEPPTSLWH